MMYDDEMSAAAAGGAQPRPIAVNFRGGSILETSFVATTEVTVRKEFPESWIFQDFDDFGSVDKDFELFLSCFKLSAPKFTFQHNFLCFC